jgi:tetratricopeptide (TPR) repeat protein
MEDLHETIDLYRNALVLHSPGHPDRSRSLSNLAHAVLIRFERVGATVDVDEAIDLYRNALALRPLGHPDRNLSLNDLAGAVFSRYNRSERRNDLDETIQLYREAVRLTPADHTLRSSTVNKIISVLYRRFQLVVNSLEDPKEAMQLCRESLAAFPIGHENHNADARALLDAAKRGDGNRHLLHV